ncbi:MAG TPA: SGNH/GDSL hydrolase family protein [Roseiarcus sp.]|nr:SGNH/GDSL hydrolase family protein [Roseiarcus sp.]
MKTALCYGDSNTWGCAPMMSLADGARLDYPQRWPTVMQGALGEDWRTIAEGLPGRTSVHEDPVEGGHMSGLSYLRPCLESHRPLDLVVLMLGTNDFKRRFSLEAEEVALGVGRLGHEIVGSDVFGGRSAKLLIVCPPPIEVVGCLAAMFAGADEKSPRLSPFLREIARQLRAGFLDAGKIIRSSPVDGIHLDADAHAALGGAVAAAALALVDGQ